MFESIHIRLAVFLALLFTTEGAKCHDLFGRKAVALVKRVKSTESIKSGKAL
ncbi:hypothetical protein [Shewanella sp. GutDb-MelDb]|uniref:hypothetical protein n=1 Tax=Shewanella sp. GutDb-MelDb TaxID=2058316 RepID=UPI0015E14E92|nr:hypothetical protein [Shewanella sp. GutDb-MelDb]